MENTTLIMILHILKNFARILYHIKRNVHCFTPILQASFTYFYAQLSHFKRIL